MGINLAEKKKSRNINWTYQSFYSFMNIGHGHKNTSVANCKMYQTSNEFSTKIYVVFFRRLHSLFYRCVGLNNNNKILCTIFFEFSHLRPDGRTYSTAWHSQKHKIFLTIWIKFQTMDTRRAKPIDLFRLTWIWSRRYCWGVCIRVH